MSGSLVRWPETAHAVFVFDGKLLPLRPIWPGFAINTVFYAVVLWLLFALGGTPFALRRRRRIKRGLCPKCAYDLRGIESSACPECGCLHRHRNLVTST